MYLLIELLQSLSFSILFLLTVESFGFLFLSLVRFLINKFYNNQKSTQNFTFTLKIITGLLFLGMSFFWLGIFHLYNKDILLNFPIIVLAISTISRLIIIIRNFIKEPIGFQIKLWVAKWSEEIKLWITENKYIFGGVSIFTFLTFPAAFRPVIQFDAIWYHLTIPKLFLQAGNIDYNGEFLRYSVHPYLNFFWNSFFLSTYQTTFLQGLAINLFQWILVIIGLFYAFKTLDKLVKFPNWLLLLGPSLIGIVHSVTNAYGAGYNDLYGVFITLFIIPTLFKLQLQKKIKFEEIIWVLLAIITLSLLKIFFALFGALAFIYLIWLILKLENTNHKNIFRGFKLNKNFWIQFSIISIASGVLFIVPWLVRSFLQTGRILDPIGAPGINEDAYNFAGSKTAYNHWSYFVWVRTAKNLALIPTIRYTPLLGLAFILPLLKAFRKSKLLPLYLLGFFGFSLIYFFSIVSEWRYFLPGVITLLLVLIIFIAENFKNWSKMWQKIVIFVSILIIPITYFVTLKTTDLAKDMYIFQNQTSDEYMQKRVGEWIYGYYPSTNSFRPKALTNSEPVLVINLQGMSYVPNPILSPYTQPKLFQNLDNLSVLVKLLKSQGIRYIMMKRTQIDQICTLTNVHNCNEDPTKFFQVEGVDFLQETYWYSLI